jgi:hypothetical protein
MPVSPCLRVDCPMARKKSNQRGARRGKAAKAASARRSGYVAPPWPSTWEEKEEMLRRWRLMWGGGEYGVRPSSPMWESPWPRATPWPAATPTATASTAFVPKLSGKEWVPVAFERRRDELLQVKGITEASQALHEESKTAPDCAKQPLNARYIERLLRELDVWPRTPRNPVIDLVAVPSKQRPK